MTKFKNSLEETINHQSADWARQVRSNTNLFGSCVPTHDRLHLTGKRPQQRSHGQHSNNKAQRLNFSFLEQSSRGKNNLKKNDAIPGRMHATHWFLGWILSTSYDLRVAQLDKRKNGYFSPCFMCPKCIPCILLQPLPYAIKYVTDKEHVVCNGASLRVVLRVRIYTTCTRVQTMSICQNLYNTTLESPGTQPLAMLLCGVFWDSNGNHYYFPLVLVVCQLATSISMYVRVPTEFQYINAQLWYLPQYHGDFITVNIVCFGTKYYANLEMMSYQVSFYQPLHTYIKIRRITG